MADSTLKIETPTSADEIPQGIALDGMSADEAAQGLFDALAEDPEFSENEESEQSTPQEGDLEGEGEEFEEDLGDDLDDAEEAEEEEVEEEGKSASEDEARTASFGFAHKPLMALKAAIEEGADKATLKDLLKKAGSAVSGLSTSKSLRASKFLDELLADAAKKGIKLASEPEDEARIAALPAGVNGWLEWQE